jgi:hypothetical protein
MTHALSTFPVGAMSTTTVDELVAQLPTWLRLMVASFPKVKNARIDSFAAYETAFADEDDDVMTDAIVRALKAHEYHSWPTIGQIARAVEDVKTQRHVATYDMKTVPFHVWHRDVFAPSKWELHEPCGELTPDVDDCPFCADMVEIEIELKQMEEPTNE